MDFTALDGALAPYRLLERMRRRVWRPGDEESFFNTRSCLINPRPINDNLRVQWADPCECYAAGRARINGTIPCNSIWSCPVCAIRISADRSTRLAMCVREWLMRGNEVLLLTLTFPHSRADSLAELLGKLALAWRHFRWESRFYRKTREQIGLFSLVRVLEITYGNAFAFHPHLHVLLFVPPGIDADWLHSQVYPVWRTACLNQGFQEPLPEYTDIRKGEHASWYVNKIAKDLSAELTMGDYKEGRLNGLTSFGLAAAGRWNLFREHHAATFGRRKLEGLGRTCKKLGIDFCADDETDDPNAELFRTVLNIERLGWRTFLGRGGTIPDLLEKVHSAGGNPDAARAYFDSLVNENSHLLRKIAS